MTPEDKARERRIDACLLRFQYSKDPDDRRKAGYEMLAEIKARNTYRTPEQTTELERAKGLR